MPTSNRTVAARPARVLIALGCLLIVMLGTAMRLVGTDWDRGSNLHPDERHMMFMVMGSLEDYRKLEPGALSSGELWFDTDRSPFNPRHKGTFYAYGELPHLVVTTSSLAQGRSDWPDILILGRTITAAIDGYTILAVFLLASLGTGNALAGLLSAAFYAFTPFALQNANFFVVDSWLTAASAWCLVFATMILRSRREASVFGWIAATGIFAGLATACKLPGLALVGILILSIAIRHFRSGSLFHWRPVVHLAAGIGCAFAAFRLACPFNFQGPGFFGIMPAPAVVDDYREIVTISLAPYYPPNWQWLAGHPRLDAVRDLGLWALGPAVTVAVFVGTALAIGKIRQWPFLLLLGVFVLVMAYYWLSIAPLLRYVLPAAVGFCVFAGAGLACLSSKPGRVFSVLLVLAAAAWSFGMVALHTRTNSRIVASAWLWNETKPGTVVAHESPWDDGLPVSVRYPGSKDLRWPGFEDHFRFIDLNLEIDDSSEKVRNIAHRLGQADYLAISSERIRKPQIALRERFPMMPTYYAMLANGELCFEQVFKLHPGYEVLGYSFDDSGAQEPWSVYDHPAVEIYKRLPCYDADRVEKRLLDALPPKP